MVDGYGEEPIVATNLKQTKDTVLKGRADVTKHETVKGAAILKLTLDGQTVRSPMKSNGLPEVGGNEQTPTGLRKNY